jgi:ABC-type nitrate/sulfonate/bicarbonate transport system ATPase subunit
MIGQSISVKNLSVVYEQQSILENISFSALQGEFIAIVGKSGAGKTTLLNALSRFIKFSGQVNITGQIGFCFQNHSLFHWMTVAENIGFGLNGMNYLKKRKYVEEILEKINMADYGKKYPRELSGGQMQRVALGRAIAPGPAVLLLDEPFSSLDIYTRDQMIDWVLKLLAELEITILMVTHYLDEALVLADRVFLIKNKCISQQIDVSFGKPRTQAIRYTEDFQKAKKELALLLNHQ